MNFIALIVAALGCAGLSLAYYIKRSKNTGALVCPLEGSCEQVITSKYSTLFGIPIEILGMIYYGIVAAAYFAIYSSPSLLPANISMYVMTLTVIAFFFSLYLTGVQAIVLKHWCTWCLISASICTLIFILVFLSSGTKIVDIFSSIF